jgi:transposase
MFQLKQIRPFLDLLWRPDYNNSTINISRSTVHRAMKSVGFSYITPRQNHYKQDKKVTEDFKKKSTK